MGTDTLVFAALVTLALAVVFGLALNTTFAVRRGLSPERATLRAERHAALLLACCAALPWVALCSVYALAVRASFALGHWPRPMINDPKSFGFSGHYEASVVLASAAHLSVFAVIALLVIAACRDIRPAHIKGTPLLFAVGYGLVWVFTLADPGHVLEWLAD